MRILITGNALDNLTGQPMSCYELARVLSKDHEVHFVVLPNRLNNNVLQRNLEALGVRCGYEADEEYDLILANEWKPDVKGYTINIVRSEYDEETPIGGCDFYVCIRPSIQRHIVEEHDILIADTKVIYNGVDRERFKPRKKSKRNFFKIVAPCTLDTRRKKMLNYIISTLNEKRQLFIFGEPHGIKLDESPYVHYHPAKFNIEEDIADADLVVGILLGRVNLEANSCGVPSIYYDPVTLNETLFFLEEEEFDKRHNIENVVKEILELYENLSRSR